MDNEIEIKKILYDDIKIANEFFDFIDEGAKEDYELYEDIKKGIKSIDEVKGLRKSLIKKRKITYKEFKKNNIKKYINRLIGSRWEFFHLRGEIAGISFVDEFVDYNNIEELKGEINDYLLRYDNRTFIRDLRDHSLFNPDPNSMFYPKILKDLLEDYKRQGLKKLKKKGSTKKMIKTILIYFLGAVFAICAYNYRMKSEINKRNSKERKKVGDVDIEFLSDKNMYENYLYHYSVLFPEGFKVSYGVGDSNRVLGIGDSLTISLVVTKMRPLMAETFNSVLDSLSKNQLSANNDFIKKLYFSKWFKNEMDSYEKKISEKEFGLQKLGLENIKVTKYEPVEFNNRMFINVEHTGIISRPNFKAPVIRDEYITYGRNNQYRISFQYLNSKRIGPPKTKMGSFLMSFIVDEVNL